MDVFDAARLPIGLAQALVFACWPSLSIFAANVGTPPESWPELRFRLTPVSGNAARLGVVATLPEMFRDRGHFERDSEAVAATAGVLRERRTRALDTLRFSGVFVSSWTDFCFESATSERRGATGAALVTAKEDGFCVEEFGVSSLPERKCLPPPGVAKFDTLLA